MLHLFQKAIRQRAEQGERDAVVVKAGRPKKDEIHDNIMNLSQGTDAAYLSRRMQSRVGSGEGEIEIIK